MLALFVPCAVPCAVLCSIQLSQESIKSAHRRLVVAHIFPATLGDGSAAVPPMGAPAPGSPLQQQPQPPSPERYSVEHTLDPQDEKEREVRALLSENKSNFAKIFEVYTRRSKQMTLEAWLAFCADFDLTNALSTTVLSTVFRGAAVPMPAASSSSGGEAAAAAAAAVAAAANHSMSAAERNDELLSMRQFLQALREPKPTLPHHRCPFRL